MTDQLTVDQMNRVIAEFMGHWAPMYYHSDWNKLMPVVEKIESQGCIVNISACLGRMCSIAKPTAKPMQIALSEDNSLIKAVYDTVYQYVLWYNTQTQNNG